MKAILVVGALFLGGGVWADSSTDSLSKGAEAPTGINREQAREEMKTKASAVDAAGKEMFEARQKFGRGSPEAKEAREKFRDAKMAARETKMANREMRMEKSQDRKSRMQERRNSGH